MLNAQGYLFLLALLALAWLAGYVMTRLGYPSLLGELAVGIICGPPLLGWFSDAPNTQPGPAMNLLGQLGTIVLMLLVGARINPRDIGKASGSALLIAVGAFAASFATGYFLTTGVFGRPMNEGLVVGVAISNTALATLPRILLDLDLIEARVGQFLAAVSLLTVAILLTMAAVVESVYKSGSVDFALLGQVILKAVIFLAATVVIGLFVFPLLKPLLASAKLTGRSHSFAVVLLVGLFFSGLALYSGLAVILGAFMAGLFLRDEMFAEGEFKAVLTSIEDVAYRFLAPIFFVAAGFKVNFGVFRTALVPLLALLIGALLAKSLAAFVLSRLSPLKVSESVVLASGMNAKGGVDIVVAKNALDYKPNGATTGVLSPEYYTIVVFLATAGSIITPIALKFGRDWLARDGQLNTASAEEAIPAPAAIGAAKGN
jgi:Kef-type K+ transport system membrane component KefB